MKKRPGLFLTAVLAIFISVCNHGVISGTSSGDDAGFLFGWPPGPLYAAGASTDLAIDGTGYFILIDPSDVEDPYYTRFGAFAFDDEGSLVSSHGHIVRGWVLERDPGTGEAEISGSITDIKIDSPIWSSGDSSSTEEYGYYESTISVDETGVISAMDTDGHTIPLFRIALAKFRDTHRLSNSGDNLFRTTEESGEAITGIPGAYGLGSIEAYALEELESSPSYETDIAIDGDGLFYVRSHSATNQFYFAYREAFRFDKEGYLVTSDDFITQGWALEQGEEADDFERTGEISDIQLESFSEPAQETDHITVIAYLDSEGENNSAGIDALSLAWNGNRSLDAPIADLAYAFSASETVIDAENSYHTISIYFDASETAAEYEFIVTCNPTEDSRFDEDPASDAGHGLLGRGRIAFTSEGELSDMTFERLVLSDPLDAGAWESQALPSDEAVPYFAFAADFLGGTETRQLIALDLGARYDGTDWANDALSTALSSGTASVRYSAANGHEAQELSSSLINDTGIVTGYYSEGLVLPLFQVALASFQDETALEKASDKLYRETTGSGAPTTGAPGEDEFGTLIFEEQESTEETSDDTDYVISCFIASVLR